ncbi:MAG: hypothetical protein ACRCX7_14450 [Cetobacterium sp.]|uniref:hypothetical protein n=1 Tax=Cetobacterium sp. TaxID=2071632 RepID=UPI003F354A2C
MKYLLALSLLLLISCSSAKPLGQSRMSLIYNSHFNTVIDDTIMVRDLGDVSLLLHEFGHVMSFKVRRPHKELVDLLNREYPVPPSIEPTVTNRELQDFITTSTGWKVKYPFKHKPDCNVVEELLANLFVIFTRRGEELEYIREHYNGIYVEYDKYYKSLKR